MLNILPKSIQDIEISKDFKETLRTRLEKLSLLNLQPKLLHAQLGLTEDVKSIRLFRDWTKDLVIIGPYNRLFADFELLVSFRNPPKGKILPVG